MEANSPLLVEWPVNATMDANETDLLVRWLEYNEDGFRKKVLSSLYTHRTPLTIALVVAYGIVFLLGLLGNVLVFFTVARYRTMRTMTYLFLVNLAVGDIMVVLVCMPLTLGYTVYRVWVYGDVLCRLAPFVQGLSVSVSVLTLLVVSIDRYYKIYHPVKARVIFHGRRVRAIVVAVWVTSALLMLPFPFVARTITDAVGVTTCTEIWTDITYKRCHGTFLFAVLYVIPVCFMMYAYSKIARTLWHGDKHLRMTDTQRQQFDCRRIQRKRRQLVKLIMALTVLFGITWLPYHVVILWLDFSRKGDNLNDNEALVATKVYPLAQWLALTNSSVNPICYCLFSKKFRTAVKLLCGCGGTDSEQVLASSESGDRTQSSFLRRNWRLLSQRVRRQGGRRHDMDGEAQGFPLRRHAKFIGPANRGKSLSSSDYTEVASRKEMKRTLQKLKKRKRDLLRTVSSPM